jgi:hypothetical protein
VIPTETEVQGDRRTKEEGDAAVRIGCICPDDYRSLTIRGRGLIFATLIWIGLSPYQEICCAIALNSYHNSSKTTALKSGAAALPLRVLYSNALRRYQPESQM